MCERSLKGFETRVVMHVINDIISVGIWREIINPSSHTGNSENCLKIHLSYLDMSLLKIHCSRGSKQRDQQER